MRNRLLRKHLFFFTHLSTSLYPCKSRPPQHKKGVDLKLQQDCMDKKILLGRRLFEHVMFKAWDLVANLLKWNNCSCNNGTKYHKRGAMWKKKKERKYFSVEESLHHWEGYICAFWSGRRSVVHTVAFKYLSRDVEKIDMNTKRA